MTATFSIDKVLTVITEKMVYYIKYSEFQNEISKFNEVTLKGWVIASKYNKYVTMLTDCGFTVSKIVYCDAKKDNTVDFRITFKK